MEPARELDLVVAGDERVVLGDQLAQPDVGGRLAVGEVMGDLARGPVAAGRPAVELVGRDPVEGVDDIVVAGAEAVDEGLTIHAG